MNKIEIFIHNFKKGFDKEYLEDVFTNGNCYHFALILESMFEGEIIYDPNACHFLTKIDYEFYDITGKVDGPIDYYIWDDFEDIDYNEYLMINRDCVYKY